jgi:Mce-associated membrane protein
MSARPDHVMSTSVTDYEDQTMTETTRAVGEDLVADTATEERAAGHEVAETADRAPAEAVGSEAEGARNGSLDAAEEAAADEAATDEAATDEAATDEAATNEPQPAIEVSPTPGAPHMAALRVAVTSLPRLVAAAGRALSQRATATSRRTRLAAIWVLAALVVCAGTGVGVLAWQDHATAATDQASAAALDAARTKLPLVLSYQYSTLNADLDTARLQIAGPFAAQFDELAASTIVPSTRDQKIVTKATVVRGAVTSTATDRVETLLFVNQSTTSADKPQPQATASQVRVVMTRVGGQWLISEVTPI